MPDVVILDSDELDAVLDKLRRAFTSPQFEAVLLRAASLVGIKAEELIGEYPAPFQTLTFRNRRYPRISVTGQSFESRFKSPKQQRKVFALLREGQIPYRRTGHLGASVYSKAEVVSNGVEVRVGATAPHARYVIGAPEEQALVHRDVWPSLPVLVTNSQSVLLETFASGLRVILK